MNKINDLPLEVFLRVMSFIDRQEKLNCQLVCKHWLKTIRTNTGLYESVQVINYHQFDSVYYFFDKYPELSKQVKQLDIIETTISMYALLMLPITFPNVEEFTLTDLLKPHLEWNEAEAEKQFAGWSTKIQSIEEGGSPIVAPTLISTQLCSNLVSLDLNFSGYDGLDPKVTFIDHLGNAPSLTYLRLHWVNMTMDIMETIFEQAPKLKAIGIDHGGFQTGDFRNSIKAAKHLETFCVDNGYFIPGEDTWLHYIANKFKGMKNFILKLGDGYDIPAFEYRSLRRISQQVLRYRELLRMCKKIEYYHVHAFPLAEDIMETIRATPSLKFRKINLGSYECMDEFKLLCASRLTNTIESLVLSGYPYSTWTYEYTPRTTGFLHELAKFSRLKHLRINESKQEVMGHDCNRVPLDLILKHLDLESLAMDFATIEVSSTSEKPFDTNLKQLVLIECYVEAKKYKSSPNMHEESADFLEKKLPNTLIIEKELDDEGSDEEYAYLFEK